MTSMSRGRGYAGRRLGETKPAIPGVGPAPPAPARPGDALKPAVMESVVNEEPPPMDLELNVLLHIDESFRPILDQLERLTPGEDGISLNRKLSDIEGTIATCVSSQTQMCDAFRSIRALCLRNDRMALKCSLAMSMSSLSRTVPLKAVPDMTMRNYYLNVMEETFGKLDILERADPQYLVNATNMLSGFYGEARLADGSALQLLALPLLGYFEALLRNESPKAHSCLATQLMQNGRRLLSAEPQKTEGFFVEVHTRLLRALKGESVVTSESSPWLLLAADVCVNKFMPLPTRLQQFYATTLNLGAAETINSPEKQVDNSLHSESYVEVGYGSWKKDGTPDTSVPPPPLPEPTNLQANMPTNLPTNIPPNIPTNLPLNLEQESTLNQDNVGNGIDQITSASYTNSNMESQMSGRKPRAILGAGARLIKMRPPLSDLNAESTPYGPPAENIPPFYPPPESHPITKQSVENSHSEQNHWKFTCAADDTFNPINENMYMKQASEIPLEFKLDNRVTDMSPEAKTFLAKRYDLNSWRQSGGGDPGSVQAIQDSKTQPFQQPKGAVYDQKWDNWRKTDRNGSFSKEPGSNWRKPPSQQPTWGDEETDEVEAVVVDPVHDNLNIAYSHFALKKTPSVENGRRERPLPDRPQRDKNPAEVASPPIRRERPSHGDTPRRGDRPPSDPTGRIERRVDNTETRPVLIAPRNHKYWDHDDRLERDYDA